MKNINCKKLVNEALDFGECYIGSEEVWGEYVMSCWATKITKYISKNSINGVYTTRTRNGEWYVIVA